MGLGISVPLRPEVLYFTIPWETFTGVCGYLSCVQESDVFLWPRKEQGAVGWAMGDSCGD